MMPRVSTTDTPEQYHAAKALSNSGITQMLRCPARFKVFLDGMQGEESEALLCGSVFHCLALEPEAFRSRYHVQLHNGATKAGKEEKAAADSAGLTMIKPAMHESCLAMADAVRSHPLVGKMVRAADSMREVSIYWEEDVRGMRVPCKARIDLLATVPGFGLVACDLKSTTDASPEGLSKSILKWGYHRQAAWYMRAIAASGREASQFIFISVEKESPHIVTPASISPAARLVGYQETQRALEAYAECEKSDNWPCYTTEIVELDLPAWAYKTM